MRLTRARRTLRLAAALAVACLGFLVFATGHAGVAAAAPHASSACPPETATCSQQAFPCPGCSVTAGPVTNVGQDQAVYVSVTGVPLDDELEIAYCSLAAGTQVVAQPQCASAVPVAGSVPTPEPLQYQYGTVTTSQTILAIPTEFDPDIPGAKPIVSQTSDQLFDPNPPTNTSGTFFCDNGSNPCGIEIMLFTPANIQYVTSDGLPPSTAYSAVGNTAIFPLTFNQGGSGCGSAPLLQVDASYSATQFIPAAGQATCTGTNGVAAVATELPSVDDSGCASGGGTHCPIYDVIDGTAPATFTDDPEDPATLAELKAAGGKFAYIPIAASGTEIAFSGSAGSSFGGSSTIFPLDSYQLTPAMAAGIMTQLWNSATASPGYPDDDLCGQLSKPAHCTETPQSLPANLKVEAANGKTDNLDVSGATSLSSENEPFDSIGYGPPDNFYFGGGETIGGGPGCTGTCAEKIFYGDTGFALLNPWPFSNGGIPTSEEQLGAMWPSTPSGASFESTAWMCDAPDVPYTAALPFGGTQSVSDMTSAQQILADAELGPVSAQNNKNGLTPGVVDQHIVYPAKKCQALSTVPGDFGGNNATVNGLYQPSSSPLTASHAVLGAIAKYGGTGGFAFTAMDSSEADFFGLLPASLQNAAGAFVGPSAQSITAALNDATKNPDGTLSPNLDDTGDPAAYPLPMVTYALVSTAPQQTADEAAQLKDLLTNLVTYSYNGGSASEPLPSGYVPLPSSLYSQAMSEIAADIVGPGGSPPGGSSGPPAAPGSAVATGPASGTAGAGSGGSSGSPGGSPGGSAGAGHSGAHGSASAATTTPSSGSAGSSPGNFIGHLITVTVGDNRYFVPALLLLALLCLLAGPLLYLSPTLRKTAGPSGDEGAQEGTEGANGRGPPEEA